MPTTPEPPADQPAATDAAAPAHPAPRPPWWATHTTRPLLPPSAARLRTRRGTLTTAALAVVLLTALAWVLTGTTQAEYSTTAYPNALERRQTTDALLGGCGGIFQFTDVLKDSGTIPTTRADGTPNLVPYTTTIVPIFGRFWADPVPTGPTDPRFWAPTDTNIPRPEQLLYNQWQGWLVVYYTRNASPGDVATLKNLAQTRPDLRLLIVPWAHAHSDLPQHRTIALATWANSQTCMTLDTTVITEFRALHPATAAPGYDGTPPPIRAH